jgi:hypothetical protein
MSEERKEYRIEGRPATIFRVVHDAENPYVMVDMRPILNEKLSWKAKGILVYLLSRPDGWEVNLVDLTNRSIDGLAAVKSGCKELKEAGHLKHAGVRKASGQFDTVIWEVYETPQVGNQLTVEPQVGVSLEVDFPSPEVDYPQVDKPRAVNRTQVLKTLSSNESNIKDIEKPDFVNLTVQEAARLPEMRIFRDTTGRIPGQGQWETVWNTIKGMNGKGNAEYLRPFWLEWSARGYRPENLNWLTEWAANGEIPQKTKSPKKESFYDKLQRA